MTRPSVWLAPCAILLLWLALIVPSLDRSHMQEVDELTHARVAQAAALEGHWWPLILDGRVFYEKPPLLIWLGGALAKLSGRPRAAWPYRVWPCLGAGLALAGLVLIGSLAGQSVAGLIAAAGLALQGDFIYHARFFTFDTLFVACMLASLALALRAVRRGFSVDWRWVGIALGLAAAIKSWFVLALVPAYACAVFVHLPRSRRKSAIWELCWPSLAVMLSWIALYVLWMGPSFLTEEWSNNLLGRIRGRNFTQDPQGHAAFYLKWVALSAPSVLPWALSAPWVLAPEGPGPGSADGRALAFARTWTRAFCLSWIFGLACVRAETMNYVVPLEAGLCLAAGLTLTQEKLGAERAWIRVGLVVASVLAALRFFDPAWSLVLGAALGFAWLFSKPASPVELCMRRRTRAIALALGLVLAVVLGREAYGLVTRPLDPNRSLDELLLAHPAKRRGETLWFVSQATQAPYFYSSYKVKQTVILPLKRPAEACLVRTRRAWIFFPAGGGPPSTAPFGKTVP